MHMRLSRKAMLGLDRALFSILLNAVWVPITTW